MISPSARPSAVPASTMRPPLAPIANPFARQAEKSASVMEWATQHGGVMLVLAALALRAPLFGNPILYSDEQLYLLIGDRMWDGFLPYVDLFDRKPVGLFLLFSAIGGMARLLGANAILLYQVVALLFVLATAQVVRVIVRRLGAGDGAALGAGLAYIALLTVAEGGGGQAPVFFNLPMALAGLIVLRAVQGDDARPVRAGILAMLLVGVGLQLKYTALFEGFLFGLTLWLALIRARGVAASLAPAAAWIGTSLLPTALAAGTYAAMGQLRPFLFANFTSILLRGGNSGMPVTRDIGLFLGLVTPLAVVAVLAWCSNVMDRGLRFVTIWFGIALAAIFAMQSFALHYAQPLLVPAAVLTGVGLYAAGWPRRIARGVAILALVAAVAMLVLIAGNDGRTAGARLRTAFAASPNCPFVFDGPVIGYLLGHACQPSRYVFPTHLGWRVEAHAIGVDPLTEVRRIMDGRPALVQVGQGNIALLNPPVSRFMTERLARDYRLEQRVRYGSGDILLYRLRGTLAPLPNEIDHRISIFISPHGGNLSPSSQSKIIDTQQKMR